MESEINITVVLASLRDQIGAMAQEKAILTARIEALEQELKGKNE